MKHICSFLLIATIFLFSSCNSGDKASDSAFINSDFETTQLEYQSFEVNTETWDTISLSNGTSIIIPSRAFVDQNNNLITGKATIRYREFHDAADILLGGIPMSYDSAGTTHHLQTAGMFEIEGLQANKPVFIRKEKSIQVNMASRISDTDFNSYYLDTIKKNWIYRGNSTVSINEGKEKKIREKIGSPVPQPIQPAEYDPAKFVFDMKINTKAYPELKDFHNIIWQYAGNSDSTDPEKNDWIFNEKWTNVELQIIDINQSLFALLLNNKNKNFQSVVKPVFSGKKLEEAKKNFKKKQQEYSVYLDRRKEELRRIQNELDFIRSYSVLQFGIHNFDIIYVYNKVQTIAATFDFDQEVSTDNVRVFLLTGDNRVVISYKEPQWKNIVYPVVQGNLLVAIMPGDKIAVCEDLKNEDPTHTYPTERNFKFKTIQKTIRKSDDLREALGMI